VAGVMRGLHGGEEKIRADITVHFVCLSMILILS